jgi:hypothetical protein
LSLEKRFGARQVRDALRTELFHAAILLRAMIALDAPLGLG